MGCRHRRAPKVGALGRAGAGAEPEARSVGATLRVLARSEAADDVLFEVTGRNFRLAEVHLTWRGETDPRWPRTAVFLDLADWQASLLEWP